MPVFYSVILQGLCTSLVMDVWRLYDIKGGMSIKTLVNKFINDVTYN